jgi:hypothetical protein
MTPHRECLTNMHNTYAQTLFSICKIQRPQDACLKIKKSLMDQDISMDEFAKIILGLFKDNQLIFNSLLTLELI